MELKCHCYEVMNVEVINIFYLTKMMCDTETDCLCCCLYKKLITINLKHIVDPKNIYQQDSQQKTKYLGPNGHPGLTHFNTFDVQFL